MQTDNYERFCVAACRGDIETVRRLAPRIPIRDLNRRGPDGRVLLNDVLRNHRRDIAQVLLDAGASCRTEDENGQTAFDIAKENGYENIFVRIEEERLQHYFDQSVANTNEQSKKKSKWKRSKRTANYVFGKEKARAYSRAIHRGCVRDRGVRATVDKIERANFVPAEADDQSKEGKLLRYYLDEARDKNDATFLIKAYTLNSLFYEEVTAYMTKGGTRKVYYKLCHKWTGYFSGSIMKNPELRRFRFSGTTYRGMIIKRDNLEYYQPGAYITNTLFQSTSQKLSVAIEFTQRREPNDDEVLVVIRYNIRNPESALSIRDLSEYPFEEEVLMLPGVLFIVDIVHTDTQPWQISVHEVRWDDT